MNNRFKRIFSVVLAVFLLAMLIPVCSFGMNIDLEREASITFRYTDGAKPIVGAKFDLYLLATYDANGSLTVTETFRDYNVNWDQNSEEYKALPLTLEGFVLRDNILPTVSCSTGSDGSVKIPELTHGLYLVTGEKCRQYGKIYDAETLIISTPQQAIIGGGMIYDVEINPKRIVREDPDSTPTPGTSATPYPGTSTTPRPGTSATPRPGTSTTPYPGTSATPYPGTSTTPYPGTSTTPYPGTSTTPYPGTSATPHPGTSATPHPGTSTTPYPGTSTTPYPGTSTTPYPGVSPTPGGDWDPTKIKVLKKWNDEGNESFRPPQIEVSLLKDGEVYDTVILNAENNWRYTWENLDGRSEYIVVEAELENYTVSVTMEGITYLLTNTFTQGHIPTPTPGTTAPAPTYRPTPTPTPKPPHLPQTGQLWWPIPLLLTAGLIFITLGVVRRRR